MPGTPRSERTDAALGMGLTVALVILTLTTAYIHLTLGGPLFTLNALGYLALAVGIAVTAFPHWFLQRLAWLPRVGLAGYAAVTIVAYLVIGPYFTLGWVAKAVEVAILVLVGVDLVRRYGSPRGLMDSAARTLATR